MRVALPLQSVKTNHRTDQTNQSLSIIITKVIAVVKNISSFVTTAVIFWAFGAGVWKAIQGFPTSDTYTTLCGVDQVSGFYGPGA